MMRFLLLMKRQTQFLDELPELVDLGPDMRSEFLGLVADGGIAEIDAELVDMALIVGEVAAIAREGAFTSLLEPNTRPQPLATLQVRTPTLMPDWACAGALATSANPAAATAPRIERCKIDMDKVSVIP